MAAPDVLPDLATGLPRPRRRRGVRSFVMGRPRPLTLGSRDLDQPDNAKLAGNSSTSGLDSWSHKTPTTERYSAKARG